MMRRKLDGGVQGNGQIAEAGAERIGFVRPAGVCDWSDPTCIASTLHDALGTAGSSEAGMEQGTRGAMKLSGYRERCS